MEALKGHHVTHVIKEGSMWILDYCERELLKKKGESQARVARYHRFLGDYFGASGFDVDEKDIPISFKDYTELLERHPGWSYGRILPSSRHWRHEFFVKLPLMNKIYDLAEINKPRLAMKYAAIREQCGHITI